MVAGLESANRSAGSLDHARSFVSQNDRAPGATLAEINVGVTNATPDHTNEHLVGPWILQLEPLDPQRASRLTQYGGLD